MNDGITADHYIAALESRIRDLEAKLAAAEADAGCLEDAYTEGWYAGRNTTSVRGHEPDWKNSETRASIESASCGK